MTIKYWGVSLIIGFWRLRRVYLLKDIGLRLIRIFTRRNCFYFSFTMSVIKLWYLLFVAIGYAVCKLSRLLINSCNQFKTCIDVYLIMEVVTSESSQRLIFWIETWLFLFHPCFMIHYLVYLFIYFLMYKFVLERLKFCLYGFV